MNEAEALRYDWFLDEKEEVCVVREEYADSGAVLAHVANLGSLFESIFPAHFQGI